MNGILMLQALVDPCVALDGVSDVCPVVVKLDVVNMTLRCGVDRPNSVSVCMLIISHANGRDGARAGHTVFHGVMYVQRLFDFGLTTKTLMQTKG